MKRLVIPFDGAQEENPFPPMIPKRVKVGKKCDLPNHIKCKHCGKSNFLH